MAKITLYYFTKWNYGIGHLEAIFEADDTPERVLHISNMVFDIHDQRIVRKYESYTVAKKAAKHSLDSWLGEDCQSFSITLDDNITYAKAREWFREYEKDFKRFVAGQNCVDGVKDFLKFCGLDVKIPTKKHAARNVLINALAILTLRGCFCLSKMPPFDFNTPAEFYHFVERKYGPQKEAVDNLVTPLREARQRGRGDNFVEMDLPPDIPSKARRLLMG